MINTSSLPPASWIIVLILLSFLPSRLSASQPSLVEFTNRCTFPVWPVVYPDDDFLQHHPIEEFQLNPDQQLRLPAPRSQWQGRFWAQIGCDRPSSNPQGANCVTRFCRWKARLTAAGCNVTTATTAHISIRRNATTGISSVDYEVSANFRCNVDLHVSILLDPPYFFPSEYPKFRLVGCTGDLNLCPATQRVKTRKGVPPVACTYNPDTEDTWLRCSTLRESSCNPPETYVIKIAFCTLGVGRKINCCYVLHGDKQFGCKEFVNNLIRVIIWLRSLL